MSPNIQKALILLHNGMEARALAQQDMFGCKITGYNARKEIWRASKGLGLSLGVEWSRDEMVDVVTAALEAIEGSERAKLRDAEAFVRSAVSHTRSQASEREIELAAQKVAYKS